ncbi:trypsin-like peptidase domain-containing protein [Candidatus Woesearchaeota archaeon]|nr:trypsin-like peptidase domain-containing protein [Candidatus Woesearchaeota archaeon]
MKRTLEGLIAAFVISATGCVANSSNLSISALPRTSQAQDQDGKYDSVDDLINPENIKKLKDASYMVISEAKYKDPKGVEITLHSLGTAEIYTDVKKKTYLVTANHVVQNDEIMYRFPSMDKINKVSEQFFLLEDYQVNILHDSLRKSNEKKEDEKFYVEDASGNKKEASRYIRTSEEMAGILKTMKPKKIKIVAQNETKDLAVISVPKLSHLPLAYSIGDAKELQAQNIVLVTGYPRGYFKNVNRGFVTSENDSRLLDKNYKNAFIFDASISPGNSGGGIFAVRDGKFELVGITSAMYTGANDLYIGVKINGVSEVFKRNSIRCVDGWKCNFSSSKELKL